MKMLEYKDFLVGIYGDTFIRKTPSEGFHVYYECSHGRILKNSMHIDLRYYITIDEEVSLMEMEIKQGSFIRENGTSRKGDSHCKLKKLIPI